MNREGVDDDVIDKLSGSAEDETHEMTDGTLPRLSRPITAGFSYAASETKKKHARLLVIKRVVFDGEEGVAARR